MPQDDSTFERHQKGSQAIYSSKTSPDALRRQPPAAAPAMDTKMPINCAAMVAMTTIRRL